MQSYHCSVCLSHTPADCRDDVVFHDDFLSNFPSYWASVPPDFKYIVAGMIPRHFDVSERTVYGKTLKCRACPITEADVEVIESNVGDSSGAGHTNSCCTHHIPM